MPTRTQQGMKADRTLVSIRIPNDLLDKLRTEYRRTYPEHALSFNAWLVRRLAAHGGSRD